MTYYAIQHITTGNYLPSGGKGKGGNTKQEAVPLNVRPPRLFLKFNAAKQALRCYLLGIWYESRSTDYEGEYCVDTGVKSYTSRKTEEFVIVKLNLRKINA